MLHRVINGVLLALLGVSTVQAQDTASTIEQQETAYRLATELVDHIRQIGGTQLYLGDNNWTNFEEFWARQVEDETFMETHLRRLPPLNGLKLQEVSLPPNLTDLRGLEVLNDLITLKLPFSKATHYEPVFQIGSLIGLELTNARITNLDGIENLTNLSSLALDGSDVADINPIVDMQNLAFFGFQDTPAAEVSPVLREISLMVLQFPQQRRIAARLYLTGEINAAQPDMSDLEDKFAQYPADEAFGADEQRGIPDFEGRDAWARSFRTRIRNALTGEPAFGGHYAMALFGCGAGCQMGFGADMRSGEVIELPFGGDRTPELAVFVTQTSDFMRIVHLADSYVCTQRDFVFDDGSFTEIGSARFFRSGNCS